MGPLEIHRVNPGYYFPREKEASKALERAIEIFSPPKRREERLGLMPTLSDYGTSSSGSELLASMVSRENIC